MLRIITVVGALAAFASSTAYAKETHQCKMPDGTIDTTKNKKDCHAAKGEWVKMKEENMPGGAK
jgi:hypothetical protein